MLLSFRDFSEGTLRVSIAGEGATYGRAPLESDLSLKFATATYRALSMDPELGYETLSVFVERARPWVVDLEEKPPSACQLVIEETANHAQSRRLRLELSAGSQGTHDTDVVVIDPSPFTLVRVQTSERQPGLAILAEYIDDADQAPEWDFASNKGEMTVTLPPQGVGEEMVKGTLHLSRENAKKPVTVPAPGELFDFRLTPVARLVLDRTDIDVARSEAPWSLRRLLGRRLGTIGVKLVEADFELLYGMAAHLESPGLRIAELDGFIGRVPYSEDLRALSRRLTPGRDLPPWPPVQGQAPEPAYAAKVAQWIGALWARPSWWRVYRDLEQRGRLVVDDGVSFHLRPTRATANPFDISRPASEKSEEGATREPLRGGVDWPYQSFNEWQELLDAPASSSGAVEGLVFGTLGAEGTQTAAFNGGKTLIITSSRQGRLESVTLIRIGRIAMLWNKARHVIVYERTTRVAPRYKDPPPSDGSDTLESQPPFDGIAALRKVREYVEITEPRRRYPDSSAPQSTCGPLTQSVFASTVIPVRSDWGHDIDKGFVIALRGPVPAGHELEFPDPRVFLDLARAPGKGDGAVSHRIRSTEKLVFFTSTRASDGGDTDQWPAWPAVDFPLLPPRKPIALPFASSFAGRQRQPDAAAVEVGMSAYTLALDPAEEAVNLMHGRDVPGLEAKVSNINLARGLPTTLPADAQQQPAAIVVGPFAEAHGQLLDGLAELRGALHDQLAISGNIPLAGLPQFQQDAKSLLGRLRGAVAQVSVPANAAHTTWVEQQKVLTDRYGDAVQQAGTAFGAQMTAVSASLDSDISKAKQQALGIVESVQQQARERVGQVPRVAQQALAATDRLLDGLTARFTSVLGSTASDLVSQLARLKQAYAASADDAVRIEALWQQTFADLPSNLRQMVDSVDSEMNGALADWFSRIRGAAGSPTMFDTLKESIASDLVVAIDWLQRWNDSLPPFDVAAPDFDGMRSTIEKVVGDGLAVSLVKKARALIAGYAASLGDWNEDIAQAAQQVDKWAKEAMDKVRAATDVGAVGDLLKATGTSLSSAMKSAADDLTKTIADQVNALSFASLQGTMDALGTFSKATTDALDGMAKELGGTLGDLERVVLEQAGTAEAYAQAGARQLEHWAQDTMGEAFEIGERNVDAGLQTLRMLAAGPVTDTLQVSRELLGYYYHQAGDALDLTRANAFFNDLGRDALNSLSTSMPFDRIRDRLLPQLDGLAIRDLFPDFCGLKLTDLLPDLDVPLDGQHEYGWLRLEHGFDKDRLRAWAHVSIDKNFDTDATLFDLGPVRLRLLKPYFRALSDLSVGTDGTRVQRTSASLDADFELSLSGSAMVTLHGGSLKFDERGELKFDFDADKVELAQELQFVTDALAALMPDVDGATIIPQLPAGVSAVLSLPLPDIGTGAFTLTGITLNTHLDLLIADGFEISTGLWLSRPERPFGLAVLFLGGGGWFGIDASYRPPSRFVTRVSVGVSAGAFLAINFGFASGSAGLLFTAGIDFYRDFQTGTGTSTLSLGLIVWGEFSVLGIASASVRVTMSITYGEGGSMTGQGTFSVSIRICWCFTLRLSRTANKTFAGSSSSGQGHGAAPAIAAAPAAPAAAHAIAAMLGAPAVAPSPVTGPGASQHYGEVALEIRSS